MDERKDYGNGAADGDLEETAGSSEGPLNPAEAGVVDELERLRADAAEWHDKYLRKIAEFDNFRRRTRQETALLREVVAESLITALLPVMDDFDRLLAAAGADDPLRRGAEMVRGKLWAFFEAQGVTVMDALGKPFNPEQHDALLLRATPGFPAGTVLEVVTPGYCLGERVVRHAQVIVSTDADGAADAPPQA